MSISPIEKINVRSIISIFESQSENGSFHVRRAKSMSSLSHKPSNSSQLEEVIQQLQKSCTSYKTYSRETHIYYQNQIIALLCELGNVDPRSRKSHWYETLKKLNQRLNSLLPGSVEHSNPKIHKSIEEVQVVNDEVDLAPVSVRTLKQIFERSARENEKASDYGATRISKRFLTFNGDFKYLPYNQKFKANAGVETNGYREANREIEDASIPDDSESESTIKDENEI